MRTYLVLAGLSLLALGCDDGADSGGVDSAPNEPVDGALDPTDGGADPSDGAMDPMDGGAEQPVVALACPPPTIEERIVTLDGPGRWRLEGCEEGNLGLRFTVPPRTAFAIEAIAGPGVDSGGFVHPPGGMNDTDAPAEIVAGLFVHDEPSPVVWLHWIDCWGVESCGADRYCAPATNTCSNCADGDEVFDIRAMDAPRTDAAPQVIDGATIEGVVCEGSDDWYVLNQTAGQAVNLEGMVGNGLMMHGYLADSSAARLADLAPLQFAVEQHAGRATLLAPDTDRTVWLRASTTWRRPRLPDVGWEPPPQAQHPYRFELGGCLKSDDCLPWWYCDGAAADGQPPAEPTACVQCAGEHDATGDHGTESAPIRVEPGVPIEGSICGVDRDWYTFTVVDPAVQVVITATEGLYARHNERTADQWFGRRGGQRVYRRGAGGVPDEIVLSLEAPSGDGEVRRYTIETEVLAACDLEVDPPACPAGRVCMGGVCVEGEPMVDPCEVACATATDCMVGDDCPGLGEADRAALSADCLGRCAQFPDVVTRINRFENCAEVIDFIREIDPGLGDRCDGQ